ncbi:hypothetical protein [Bacillus sp. Au-Bac7]|uniref:hypothetical protein n=1 Tax=Bacillus sp. Au-Bac7 TaxID=2906458 RepID=UPI001E52AF15|nr:hypothetical protein [Bacillus sp. Au-Bac7]MCE4051671.1 hypothetical protein [Bacillus sp. Au-Bac7]
MENYRENFIQDHAPYINENRDTGKKITYCYAFNWHGFTHDGVKHQDYNFNVDIRFDTHLFEEDHTEDAVTDFLSVSIDLEKQELKIEKDDNPLFKKVQIFSSDLSLNGGFYLSLNEEERNALIKEYCKQVKENQITYVDLTGSPIAFSYR